ncbi:2-oxoglutarate dehydrogenase complex dihydrolipoyllysine-residue succinyltransferase [Entomobacter blattae]|uniref:Dihydrolipoyllysine-residue succinyltransferase component of 2-oxoglutarate dehydrogenase complex n=1 Tax=Entomobacter blattae TaxID=2762277 RepID=A0A7H1NPG9_9PROT|nr:2-oxoglutarate dehydrogenase complex dihydrolipoyllysine-residue succinyltransferase [Entomobacter blattae]QNT77679.1 Dihydrolipoyllysine-residue succinyltransferase component of 2-oxoglutarate dehydrogenase complex [Entomobacter blattae]
MSVEIKVPELGESITTALVARWLKQPGEGVKVDDPLVELETDKVSIEIPAPVSGIMGDIYVNEGEEVEVGALLAMMTAGEAPSPEEDDPRKQVHRPSGGVHPPQPNVGLVSRPAPAPNPEDLQKGPQDYDGTGTAFSPHPMPAAKNLMQEHGVEVGAITSPTGRGGRITKADVLAFLEREKHSVASQQAGVGEGKASRESKPVGSREERVKMTRLRATIARRLKEAQNTAAILTTFNEVDMSAIIGLRKKYKEPFEKRHQGARLGFMSFFVRAAVKALAEFPVLNAEIDGEDIIYRDFMNIGIAVGGANGLVVPVLCRAEQLSFAEIEAGITQLGQKARAGQLKLEELAGGTFSITNGGIYGSMMSTPILNAPQSAILGMHSIKERPMAVEGQVVIRPMMYLALSYDHRIVDGKEAVSFLVKIKDYVEDPMRLLLDV